MLTDSYGGTCPNCGYTRMLVRYGSAGYFQRDACPNCYFYCGHNGVDPEVTHEEGWETDLDALKPTLEQGGFPLSVLGILLYIESLPDLKEKEIKSVFDYTNFNWEELKHGAKMVE